MSYHNKYIKYKNKYLTLKKSLLKSDCVYNFYFVHSTFNFRNLIDILKSGTIYPGKDLPPKIMGLSGSNVNHDNIFMNIYFEDIKNLASTRTFSLFLHPKILFDNGFIFNKGWISQKNIIVTSDESPLQLNHKLSDIREFLIDPSSLPEIIRKEHGSYHHEVTFDHSISLFDGNLLGIVCGDQTADLQLVNKLAKKYNAKVFTDNFYLPKFDEFNST